MQAIITSVQRSGKKYVLSATSASGKYKTRNFPEAPSESYHRQLAVELSSFLGFGSNLVGGETRTGFAYVPVPAPPAPLKFDGNEAAAILAAVCNEHVDPIRFASGVKDLCEIGHKK